MHATTHLTCLLSALPYKFWISSATLLNRKKIGQRQIKNVSGATLLPPSPLLNIWREERKWMSNCVTCHEICIQSRWQVHLPCSGCDPFNAHLCYSWGGSGGLQLCPELNWLVVQLLFLISLWWYWNFKLLNVSMPFMLSCKVDSISHPIWSLLSVLIFPGRITRKK